MQTIRISAQTHSTRVCGITSKLYLRLGDLYDFKFGNCVFLVDFWKETISHMPRRKQRSFFNQVSEFDRGRIGAYRDCGLSFRDIDSRVGRNPTSVIRICDRWMQEGKTDRRVRPHPPQCPTSRDDRQIERMAVTDRSATSRTIAQCFQSVTHLFAYHSTPFTAEWSVRKTSIASSTHRRLRRQWSMKEGCGRQNGIKLSLLTSHASVWNTVERGCWIDDETIDEQENYHFFNHSNG